ncbi:MAG TPA: SCO family protein [Tepidisphaeraceae bacterium]|nr:SCO family protein [Tepidisphaeraceae bacterium]
MKSSLWSAALLVLSIGTACIAQDLTGAVPPVKPGSGVLPDILKRVGIDQNVGAAVPGDLTFTNDDGKTVQLKSFFNQRPIVLVLVYYRCPMLCSLVMHNLVDAMSKMPETVGEEYDVLTVSFDPRDTPAAAAEKKREYLQEYGRDAEDGWHFLTGRQPSITRLTNAVGFHYVWNPQFQVYTHPSGIMVLTPDGRISRYFFGVNYAPDDLRLALTDASGGHIGSVVDSILLYCCYYNPVTGKYNVAISRFLKIGGAVLVLGVSGMVTLVVRRGRKNVGSA